MTELQIKGKIPVQSKHILSILTNLTEHKKQKCLWNKDASAATKSTYTRAVTISNYNLHHLPVQRPSVAVSSSPSVKTGTPRPPSPRSVAPAGRRRGRDTWRAWTGGTRPSYSRWAPGSRWPGYPKPLATSIRYCLPLWSQSPETSLLHNSQPLEYRIHKCTSVLQGTCNDVCSLFNLKNMTTWSFIVITSNVHVSVMMAKH